VVDDKLFRCGGADAQAAYPAAGHSLLGLGQRLKKAAAAAAEQAQEPRRRQGEAARARAVASAIYCAGRQLHRPHDGDAKLQGIPPAPDPHEVGIETVALHQGVPDCTAKQATVKLKASTQSTGGGLAPDRQEAKDVPLWKALGLRPGYTGANS